MFALSVQFLAFLTLTSSQSGTHYLQDQLIVPDDRLQYDDMDALPIGEDTWPESSTKAAGPAPVEDHNPLNTAKPHPMEHQGASGTKASEVVEESSVWKIAVVVVVLLVALVGSMSVAYYLCVWRGGRIYYQPQKEGYP